MQTLDTKLSRRQRGASAVEFALVAPLFFLLLFFLQLFFQQLCLVMATGAG